MNEAQKKKNDIETGLESWMDTANVIWGSMIKMMPVFSDMPTKPIAAGKKPGMPVHEQVEPAIKFWNTFASMMKEPETIDSLFLGINALPNDLVNMFKAGWDGFSHLQNQLMEKAERIGESLEKSHIEHLDKESFDKFTEIYQNEFRKYFTVPQVGLARYYQERAEQAIDKFNLLHCNFFEFLYFLYMPIEESLKEIQKEFGESVEKRNRAEDSKGLYNAWVKKLEERYMAMYKSPEYTEVLGNVVNALGDFTTARQKVIEDVLKMLPIPSQTEMDELYKDIYQMKKRIRALEKKNKGGSIKTVN